MPFDDDIDIQMKASELVRLVPFNMTMIAPFILLDVNPHFHDRTTYPGNPNVIDARVIDTRTGYFMDITGLAPVHPSPQGPFGSSAVVWQCKSPWQYRAADLFPLVPTHFEGFATFRPRNYHGALVQEYPAYRVPSFRSYVFDFAERAWVLASSSNLSQLNRIPPLSFLLWSFWVEASALSMLLKLSIGFLLILLLAMLALLVALSRTSTRIAKAARNK
ncbi:uncharacterized protein BJ171DRAFT_500874 [Polychytrium aggregatum]|uniref:uncharacterized protein n=1 Tax=Polychytrium aggregatum TaxID=110093 RepID=UPI0022FE2F95|nr:uncharacterized protein BJ171DRAFT_500874 [Polychytrium aggregatum]KAI9205597.1 hypothetical protein BJ171DRAFT_500874 [Polychytrium aggregatum]